MVDLTAVESEVEKAKEVLKGTDTDAVRASLESLTAASHKMAEAMYRQSGGAAGGPEGAAGGEGGPQADPQAQPGSAGAKKDGDVIDAEFE